MIGRGRHVPEHLRGFWPPNPPPGRSMKSLVPSEVQASGELDGDRLGYLNADLLEGPRFPVPDQELKAGFL